MYKLIIFDWDGTLMDSEAKIVSCLRLAIKNLNFEHRSDSLLKDIIGLGLTEAILKLYPDFTDEEIKLFINEYRDQFLERNTTPSALFEGVSEMLYDLKQKNLFLAVATGKSRKGLNRELTKFQMHDFFNSTRCADETLSKPEPLMLTEILGELDIAIEQSLMVGDTSYDLEMANNIGMKSVAISHGVHNLERLLAYKPVTNVSCISELHHCLNDLIKI